MGKAPKKKARIIHDKIFHQMEPPTRSAQAYLVIPINEYQKEILYALRASDPPSTKPEIWKEIKTGGWGREGVQKQLNELCDRGVIYEQDDGRYNVVDLSPAVLIPEEILL